MQTLKRFSLKLFLFASFFLPCKSFANSNAEAFARYPNEIFIETGTHVGHGVLNALQAGFKTIHTIELSPKYYQEACEKFKNYSNVHIYLGDSSEVLVELLKTINEPVTFWLDGHYSWGDTAWTQSYTPILRELKAIASHPIKNHKILIDDVRLFSTAFFDNLSLNQVFNALREINPNYTFSFEDGYIANDILVAHLKE